MLESCQRGGGAVNDAIEMLLKDVVGLCCHVPRKSKSNRKKTRKTIAATKAKSPGKIR